MTNKIPFLLRPKELQELPLVARLQLKAQEYCDTSELFQLLEEASAKIDELETIVSDQDNTIQRFVGSAFYD